MDSIYYTIQRDPENFRNWQVLQVTVLEDLMTKQEAVQRAFRRAHNNDCPLILDGVIVPTSLPPAGE